MSFHNVHLDASRAAPLIRRQNNPSSQPDQFLKLISNPFQSAFSVNAVWASLGTSIGIAIFLTLLFSLFRPRHNVLYAPKVKHADSKHMPPPVGKGLFAWVAPVVRTKEDDLVDRIGLDAAVFLRFVKMCRNIFLTMSVIGCLILIPVNITQSRSSFTAQLSAFTTMTPMYVSLEAIWTQVVCAWAFNIIIALFLWWNYRAVRRLRRRYFQSSDYQRSLHARSLMITDIPPSVQSDEGLLRLTEEVNPTAALPRASIGRNVKILPDLIKEHDEAVRNLEIVLAKYLKRPDRLPPNRPTLRPPKEYREQYRSDKVDAIDFLTMRIKVLEEEIKHVRASIDRRDAMSYGFASWDRIDHAHAVAYTARNKHPHGTTIRLAPRPSDLIWENLALSKQARRWKRIVNMLWVTLLTVVWIVPNAMIAVFLSNLSNLGSVWPSFQTSLDAHPRVWAAVQGIASPALTSLVYLILPIIFRRLAIQAGEKTKTSRERHVLHQLYAFFIFNNLVVFSLFSAAWRFISTVISATHQDETAWQAINDAQLFNKIVTAFCQVSPFWVSYLLQRNLGAALDLVQLVNMVWIWFVRTFMSTTPRQAIEWTAPPPFDYASYYNYFLFYATVAFCFSTLQPVILPVTALYFGLDSIMKEYLLLYVFVTKTESGGRFWRAVYNRMVFATILADCVVALVARAKGTWTMVYCVVPLPFLMLAFKYFCARTFDDDCEYVNRNDLTDAEAVAPGASSKKNKSAADRLSSKFGHPALYKPLITPMVHAKAAEAVKRIYSGRMGSVGDVAPVDEYSDIAMDAMSSAQPGKKTEERFSDPSLPSAAAAAPFEVVSENQLDFSYFKDRPEFRDEFGGGIYGRPDDLMTERSQTPRSFMGMGMAGGADWSPSSSRASSPAPSLPGARTAVGGYDAIENQAGDLEYPTPFRPPMSRGNSGSVSGSIVGGVSGGMYQQEAGHASDSHLVEHAQAPARSDVMIPSATGRWRTGGYGPIEQDEPSFTSYEHYRMSR